MRILRSGLVRALFALGVLFFCTAPAPGDIGGCGQNAQPLDPPTFFSEKKRIDCEKCNDCELMTEYCDEACSEEPAETDFVEGCAPIVHDGEVCLNALEASSCSTYEDYVKDQGREAPEECRFCTGADP